MPTDGPIFEAEDARGRRTVRAVEFPLALGQVDEDRPGLAIPNVSGPVAWLGLEQGDLFVQPDPGTLLELRMDGGPITGSRWLRAGDVVGLGSSRLRVEAGRQGLLLRIETIDQANTTLPPASPPRLRPPLPEAVSPKPVPPEAVPPRVSPSARPSGTGPTIRPVEFRPSHEAPAVRRGRRRFGLVGALVLLFLLALGAVALFLFAARSVGVEVTPSPDLLRIEGGWQVPLAGRFLVLPGQYRVRAEKAGHEPLETTITVDRAANQDFRFELAKLPDLLAVVAAADDGPLAGAEVRVDGELVGETPLENVELAEGSHTLVISAPRHADYVQELAVDGGGQAVRVEALLEPRWARIAFESEPAGARLEVDGQSVGTTPVSVDLEAGTRRYRLVRAGYRPHRGKVEVVAREAARVGPVRLRPADGNLSVSSEPEGASVTVDGTFRGRTPLDLKLAPGREVRLGFTLAGHAPAERRVRMTASGAEPVLVRLEPRVGEVRVSAYPPSAELWIDGESRGPADGQVLALPTARKYRLEVRAAGYVPFGTEITPLDGVSQAVEARLETEAEARERAIQPTIKTAAGQTLRLLQPGRLQMGASRREPGRRANETLRQVELTRRFYLGQHEVTNEQFRRFRAEHDSGIAGGQSLNIDDRPVVRITWQDAARYCNWLSEQEGLPPAYVDDGERLVLAVPMTLGYRLPTEAEWAWAARYGPRGGPRKYPWGDSMPLPDGAGNYADSSAEGVVGGVLESYSDGYAATAPVGAFAADGRGLHDLGGNVAEWVHDLYAIIPGTVGGVERDPTGAEAGSLHVIRGSSWMHSSITELRSSFRDYGKDPRPDVGFRLARYAE